MALVLCELGAKVYCIDLPDSPGDKWKMTKRYVDQLGLKGAELNYIKSDVTDQKGIWNTVKEIHRPGLM